MRLEAAHDTCCWCPLALVWLSSGMSRVASPDVILSCRTWRRKHWAPGPPSQSSEPGALRAEKDQGFGCGRVCTVCVCLCPCALCVSVCASVCLKTSPSLRGRLDPSAQEVVVNSGCLPAEPLVSCRRRAGACLGFSPGSQGLSRRAPRTWSPGTARGPTIAGAQPQSHWPVGSAQGHRAPL